MTELDLLFELERGLTEHLQNFKLPVQESPARAVQVHALKLPGSPLDEKLYPLVFLELLGTSDEATGAIAQVLITVGTYSTDDLRNGLVDLTNLTRAVKEFLLQHKLIGAASLQYPLETYQVESDSADFYFWQILATYKIFTVQKNYLEY